MGEQNQHRGGLDQVRGGFAFDSQIEPPEPAASDGSPAVVKTIGAVMGDMARCFENRAYPSSTIAKIRISITLPRSHQVRPEQALVTLLPDRRDHGHAGTSSAVRLLDGLGVGAITLTPQVRRAKNHPATAERTLDM
jgi:hypothetical protein